MKPGFVHIPVIQAEMLSPAPCGSQPIIMMKELEVDRQRYEDWKRMIRKQRKESKP